MESAGSPRMIVFHHVPKTGGTYVLRALAASLRHARARPLERLLPVRFRRVGLTSRWPASRWLVDLCRLRYHGLSSHWAFHPSRFNPRGFDFYFTWLRDPGEMFLSAWRYYRDIGFDVEVSPRLRLTRQVELIRTASCLGEYLGRCEAGADFFPCGAMDDLDLGAFDFVGRCERMDEDLEVLMARLGLELRIPKRHVNVSPGPPLSEAHRVRVDGLVAAFAYPWAAERRLT